MQKILEKYKNHIVKPRTQKKLNKPLVDETGFNEGHEDFLNNLINLIEGGRLDLHNPETLYNKKVYQALSEEEQEKASLTAINLISTIRQIDNLWKLDKKATFQIQNLVETVFQMKSRFEKEHGDVYII